MCCSSFHKQQELGRGNSSKAQTFHKVPLDNPNIQLLSFSPLSGKVFEMLQSREIIVRGWW